MSGLDSADRYGDNPAVKCKHVFRDVSGNINGLQSFRNNDKDPLIAELILALKADSVGLTELNLDWRKIPSEDNFWSKMRSWQVGPCTGGPTHNTTSKPHKTVQHGGCATIALERLLPRVISVEQDPTHLGRWISQVIEGKGNHRARLVTGYLPCKNTGKETVYTQHKAHFQKTELPTDHPRRSRNHTHDDREPIQAWIEDFKAEVTSWTSANEKVVIRMDANSDVRTGHLANMLRSLGFEEQITFRHARNGPPPATHIANTKGVPIDGIWTNFAHGTMRCGYMAFHEGLPSDHRTAWIDLPMHEMLGYRPPDIHRRKPPNLIDSDPCIRKQCNRRVHRTLLKQGTMDKVKALRQMVKASLETPNDPPPHIGRS